jgi:hypothetical protein
MKPVVINGMDSQIFSNRQNLLFMSFAVDRDDAYATFFLLQVYKDWIFHPDNNIRMLNQNYKT